MGFSGSQLRVDLGAGSLLGSALRLSTCGEGKEIWIRHRERLVSSTDPVEAYAVPQ